MKASTDNGKYNATLNDYLREVICVCPKCGGPARITAKSKYAIPWNPTNVMFICLKCPNRQTWTSQPGKTDFANYNPSDGNEPYFGYPLYLQEKVVQHVLVAFSKKHVEDLVEYIAAKDRPSPENSKWAMVNRLPKWVKLAKNRTPVLKALNQMQKRIEDHS